MIKQILLLTILTLVTLTETFGFVVLLDPGHGGSEYGAVATMRKKNSKGKYYTRRIKEKDLSLKLAKKIKKQLQNHFTVYLTRSFDRKVSLEERSKMADTVKADLFISIHFNASTEKKSAGFETYYLDNHKNKAIKKVEDHEHQHLKGEDKLINHILVDLVIAKTVTTSKKLAKSIHGNLNKNIKRRFNIKDRGIKPGLFYVLALSKRPGVLIEAGFITNPAEVRKLTSSAYVNAYANSIATGIIKYYCSFAKSVVPLF
jgi:N-acetylmuramoyl-L-alanine amidase